MLWKKVFIFILAAVAAFSCSKEENGYPDNSLQDFCLKSEDGTVMSQLGCYDSNITVIAPRGTDLTHMTASYKTSASKVTINDIDQVSGKSVNDFTYPVTYSVYANNGRKYTYNVNVIISNLPVIYAYTPYPNTIQTKTTWLEGCKISVRETDGSISPEAVAKMRFRGNATMKFPKKAYAVKFDKKQEMFGMPADKRWNLIANWRDVTEIRNAVSLEIARHCPGLAWTPHGEFVELFMNGQHQGLYYLCEHIKIDKDRIDITEMTPEDNHGEALSGGYLLELDEYFDEPKKFRSGTKSLPYMIKEPDSDVLTDAQFEFIKNYVNNCEKVLYAADFKQKYKGYFDIDSFIDWWFVHELTGNTEPGCPRSTYIYKDRNGKLTAGPVWDFDYSTFIPGRTSFVIKNAMYYGRFFKDEEFVARVKEKWVQQKAGFDEIPEYIDKIAAKVDFSAERDYVIWPVSTKYVKSLNGDEFISHDAAVERLKNTYIERLAILDKKIMAL